MIHATFNVKCRGADSMGAITSPRQSTPMVPQSSVMFHLQKAQQAVEANDTTAALHEMGLAFAKLANVKRKSS